MHLGLISTSSFVFTVSSQTDSNSMNWFSGSVWTRVLFASPSTTISNASPSLWKPSWTDSVSKSSGDDFSLSQENSFPLSQPQRHLSARATCHHSKLNIYSGISSPARLWGLTLFYPILIQSSCDSQALTSMGSKMPFRLKEGMSVIFVHAGAGFHSFQTEETHLWVCNQ